MNEFAKFEDGDIWWKGTKPEFFYMGRQDAVRLRDRFVEVSGWFRPRATEFIRDLDNAIAQYDEWEKSRAA